MKYSRQDNTRIKVIELKKKIKIKQYSIYLFIFFFENKKNIKKELMKQLERFSKKSIELKRATDEEMIEYHGLEIELDKIAENFRRSHMQRQQLIQRWETILEQMQRKDHNIDKLATVVSFSINSVLFRFLFFFFLFCFSFLYLPIFLFFYYFFFF